MEYQQLPELVRILVPLLVETRSAHNIARRSNANVHFAPLERLVISKGLLDKDKFSFCAEVPGLKLTLID